MIKTYNVTLDISANFEETFDVETYIQAAIENYGIEMGSLKASDGPIVESIVEIEND